MALHRLSIGRELELVQARREPELLQAWRLEPRQTFAREDRRGCRLKPSRVLEALGAPRRDREHADRQVVSPTFWAQVHRAPTRGILACDGCVLGHVGWVVRTGRSVGAKMAALRRVLRHEDVRREREGNPTSVPMDGRRTGTDVLLYNVTVGCAYRLTAVTVSPAPFTARPALVTYTRVCPCNCNLSLYL